MPVSTHTMLLHVRRVRSGPKTAQNALFRAICFWGREGCSPILRAKTTKLKFLAHEWEFQALMTKNSYSNTAMPIMTKFLQQIRRGRRVPYRISWNANSPHNTGIKMQHDSTETPTSPKNKTGSEFIWRHQSNVGNKCASISDSITASSTSGVFRISLRRSDMRRWCRVELGVVEGLGTSPEKKIIFCPKNDKFECILPQFLTGRKHGSLGTRILQFNREITKLTKQCKIYG